MTTAEGQRPARGVPGEAPGEALEALFRRHHAQVLRTAYRILGNLADAEDVLQSVFLRLARGWEAYSLRSEAGGYIHRMTVNAAIDLLRERPRTCPQGLEDLAPERLASPSPNPERQHRGEELKSALRDALTQLSPRSAQIFALRYLEERGNTEIARMLGLSRITVGVILHYARRRLRQELGRHWESRHE